MSDHVATLVLTRPRAGSEAFLAQLGDEITGSLRVLLSPVMEIVPTGAVPDLSRARGVIFTSANGVRFAGAGTGLPAYCVGRATTAAAAAAGWRAQASGDTAGDLVESLTRAWPPAPLVHVGGIHRRGDVSRRLTRAGLETSDVDVYDQKRMPLTRAAREALAGDAPVIVPLFSPRTARLFADLASTRAPLHLVAISDAVMQEASDLQAVSRSVVARPDARSMCIEIGNILRRVEAGHAPK